MFALHKVDTELRYTCRINQLQRNTMKFGMLTYLINIIFTLSIASFCNQTVAGGYADPTYSGKPYQQQQEQQQQQQESPKTESVVAEGDSGSCFARDVAVDLAEGGAKNQAYSLCDGLGDGWRFSGVKFSGYIGCTPCSGGERGNFRCKVTQSMYNCSHR
jgi:hypothetical protein